jgi:hypothetical protein
LDDSFYKISLRGYERTSFGVKKMSSLELGFNSNAKPAQLIVWNWELCGRVPRDFFSQINNPLLYIRYFLYIGFI